LNNPKLNQKIKEMNPMKNIRTISAITILLILAINFSGLISSAQSETIITGKVVVRMVIPLLFFRITRDIKSDCMASTLRKRHRISETGPKSLLQDLF